MNTIKAIIIILTIGIFTACNTTKSNVNEEGASSSSIEEETKMTEAGFKKGTIVYSDEEGDCPYVIDVDDPDYDYMLDPINLDENYKADGVKIWFKFAGLRMPNRCEKANPINILEIQSRD